MDDRLISFLVLAGFILTLIVAGILTYINKGNKK